MPKSRVHVARRILSAAAMLALITARLAASDQSYHLRPIGLVDTDDGPHGTYYSYNNEAIAINQAGEVAGSASFNIFENNTWVYLPATQTTQQIGLEDAVHTIGGHPDNVVHFMTASGLIAGHAARFDTGIGNDRTGSDAWVYSPVRNTTQMVGLTDAGHVRTDGYTGSQPQFVNANDQVVGVSNRFNGFFNTGADVWIYSPSTQTTTPIGLMDAAHTRSDGYSLNIAVGINDSGQIVGNALRYAGSAQIGADAWLYDFASHTTTQIGLFDLAHTQIGGTSTNQVNAVNNAGDIIGTAEHYSGSADKGQDAWVYSASTHTTQVIGLTDAAHTDSTGNTLNTVAYLADNGEVCGTAYTSTRTYDCWVYSPTTHATTLVGLPRATTSNIGNQIELTNHGGEIVGSANTNGGSTLATWVYTPSDQTTRQIGLLDETHTTPSGNSHNESTFINASGMVAGFADRPTSSYPGLHSDGDQDAWVYDPTSQTTYALIGSVDVDGGADSHIEYLSDDGTAVGYYLKFASDGGQTETAFRWTEADGLQDLGTLVADDLTSIGWANLYQANVENPAGQIAGLGDSPDGLAYLLTPTSVPEPASMFHIILLAPFVGIRRRLRR